MAVHSTIMMRVNWRKHGTVTVFRRLQESYTQVTIQCTSTKSTVKLGLKSAAAKAAVAAAVAMALASTVTAEELGIFILSVWGPILRRQSGVIVEHSSQHKNSI